MLTGTRVDWSRKKRYGWWRCYNDIARHPKWRVVARRANVPVHEVVAIVLDLLCAASKTKRRGSLDEFKPLECAAALDIEPEHVARVYATLEDPIIGWIDQDCIVDWFERQPDIEDPTMLERKRRSRAARRAAEREAAGLPAEPKASGSAAKPSDDSDARFWLFGRGSEDGEGVSVVCRQTGRRALAARSMIHGWHTDIGRDAAALVTILRAADREALTGEAFERVVTQRISQHVVEKNRGPALPFGPTPIRKSS
jgi:hypothetical protein